jgi:cell division protease FtsH
VTGFASVAGCQEALEDLEELVDFLKDPAKYHEFGATNPRGALLVGPPGTGKTLLARSVAAEAGVPFISANGSDFVEMFVGVGAKRIRELYTEARSHRRAIVFIDEIDAVARRRGTDQGFNSGSTAEHENTLIALLTELDGFAASEVITIAATNRPDVLDPAVLRPGRLDRRIEVPVPDRAGREAILQKHVRNKPVDSDVVLATIAARTPGMSGADLARVANEAALTAIRKNQSTVTMECFTEAVELVALGRARPGASQTDRDRRITAWHEAGHALAGLLLEELEDPFAVTVVPRGPAGGVTWMGTPEDLYFTRDTAKAQLVALLAGRAAEEFLLGGSSTQGAASDLESASALATDMVNRYGFTSRGLSVRSKDTSASHRAVDVLLNEAHEQATTLLRENAGLLEAIAQALLERQRLDRDELRALRSKATPGRYVAAAAAGTPRSSTSSTNGRRPVLKPRSRVVTSRLAVALRRLAPLKRRRRSQI